MDLSQLNYFDHYEDTYLFHLAVFSHLVRVLFHNILQTAVPVEEMIYQIYNLVRIAR